MSQLDLSTEANVSARHISFLETGRSHPSPEMIGRLGDALQLPLTIRNQMLTDAGFAARYPTRPWEAESMAPVRMAVDHMLQSHSPYPALALDRLWRVLQMNQAAKALFGLVGLEGGGSLLELMVSDTLPPVVENWPEVAHGAAQRLRTESTAQGGVPELDRVADQLTRRAGLRRDARATEAAPVLSTVLRMGDMRLSLFATIAQFGTPEDLALDDLKIELYFPADEATKQALSALEAG